DRKPLVGLAVAPRRTDVAEEAHAAAVDLARTDVHELDGALGEDAGQRAAERLQRREGAGYDHRGLVDAGSDVVDDGARTIRGAVAGRVHNGLGRAHVVSPCVLFGLSTT